MKLFYLLVFLIVLSSCSKTSEFAVQTASIFVFPTEFAQPADNSSTIIPDTIVLTDTVATNFAYSFQANQTTAGNVKQILVENVTLSIINNSFGNSFDHFKTITVAMSNAEATDVIIATFSSSVVPTTIPIGVTTLQASSGANAAAFINSDSYQLKVTAIVDTIPFDMQIQANVAFYVKAKTD